MLAKRVLKSEKSNLVRMKCLANELCTGDAGVECRELCVVAKSQGEQVSVGNIGGLGDVGRKCVEAEIVIQPGKAGR